MGMLMLRVSRLWLMGVRGLRFCVGMNRRCLFDVVNEIKGFTAALTSLSLWSSGLIPVQVPLFEDVSSVNLRSKFAANLMISMALREN